MKVKLVSKKAAKKVTSESTSSKIKVALTKVSEAKESMEKDIEEVVKPKIVFNIKKDLKKKEEEKKSSITLPDFAKKQLKPQLKAKVPSESVTETPKNQTEISPNATSITETNSEVAETPQKELKVLKKEEKKLNKNQVSVADLNAEQKQTIDYGLQGVSHCLIGAAGTGKTTAQRVLTQELLDYGLIKPLTESSKYFAVGMPSILICSFTNKAVENIRAAVPDEFKSCCMTIHKAIEFAPVRYEEEDADGLPIEKIRFEPQRNAENKLPEITYCIVEEASTIGTTLFSQLVDALPSRCTFIFLGDLNQLPPVMDDAILGFALNHLPIVELTQVYRQALESPIISFAYEILKGKGLKKSQIDALQESYGREKLKFIPFEKWDAPNIAIQKIGRTFQTLAETERLKVDESVVLLPFNTGGDINVYQINRYIAQGITNRTNKPIFEIIAGWNKYYYSIGDILFAGKSLYRIRDIELNSGYVGVPAMAPTDTIDRWGKPIPEKIAQNSEELLSMEFDIDSALEDASLVGNKAGELDEKKNQASHIISLEPLDFQTWDIEEQERYVFPQIQTAAEVNEASFGYALTIHKSQGSEWKHVYLIFADQHSRMLQRELLYTGVTRARENLTILYQPEGMKKNKSGRTVKMACVFDKGIVNQEIPGKKLQEKLRYYQNAEKSVKLKLKLQARAEAKSRLRVDRAPDEVVEAIQNELWAEHPMRKNIKLFLGLNEENNNETE